MALLNALPVQKVLQVLGELLQGEGCLPPGRTPVPPGIQGDDPIMGGKGLHLVLKIGVVLSVSVEQDQGEALPHLLVVQRDIHVSSCLLMSQSPAGLFCVSKARFV